MSWAQESSEIADFWSMLQGFQTSGKCIEKAHYRIRYMKSFRPLSVKEDIEFKEARPILYLNTAAVASLFNSRNRRFNFQPLELVHHHVLPEIPCFIFGTETGQIHHTSAKRTS